ncbi:MAG: sodium:proton exchanger [Epulopiscium sp. Nuni2H_MBin003]|nr:MAG: sodium:proton exchanger [Epulopiscium sp. Nuni2H_MBin003]
MSYILLLVGFIALIKGADYFIDGASSIALYLKITPLIIGLTIVAFGTSAPELAVSITSALQGQNAMSLGNVIGSNIFNFMVVVGASAVIFPLTVQDGVLSKEFPIAIVSTIIVAILGMDWVFSKEGALSRNDGIILLVFFSMFILYLIQVAIKAYKNNEPVDDINLLPLNKSIIFAICGAIGIFIGGDLVVNNSVKIALDLGMSERMVGLTIIAVGTSLPELVTSITAARKGESDIALGNVLGSSIFNTFLILGVSTSINPINVNQEVFIDLFFMLDATLIAYIFATTSRKIKRTEGILLLIGYFSYMTYIIFR